MVSLTASEVRVTTCRLSRVFPEANPAGLSAEAEEILIRRAVETLNAVSADVIVVRDVRDRRLCRRIAERLTAGTYGVVACSDFGPVPGSTAEILQVAILSRCPAFSAWAESPKREDASNGFVFAGTRCGDVDVWTYALPSAEDSWRANPRSAGDKGIVGYDLFLRHLASQSSPVGPATDGRARAFVISGDIEQSTLTGLNAVDEATRILTAAGFRSGSDGKVVSGADATAKESRPAMSDLIFTSNVKVSRPAGSTASDPSFASVTSYGLVPSAVAPSTPVATGKTEAVPAADRFDDAKLYLIWPVMIVGVVLLAWFFGHGVLENFRIRKAAAESTANKNFSTALSRTTYVNRLATESSPVGAISEAPTETASTDVLPGRRSSVEDHRVDDARDRLMPHLARMMKDKLLWRLLAQRSHTIQIHDASTRVVAELEQRLALIQSHFESRVRSYENRIAELERELATKESINRELLESKVQVARLAVEQEPPPRQKPSVVYTLRFGDLMAKKPTVNTRSRQESDAY